MGRGFTPRFALQVGGHAAAFVNNIKGGDCKQELQKIDLSSHNIQEKVVHGLTVTPFETEIALGMSEPMIKWIYDTIKNILARSQAEKLPTNTVANQIAEERVSEAERARA